MSSFFKVIRLNVFLYSFCFASLSNAHRPFPEVKCLNSIESNCISEIKKPSFRKYELNFYGPTSEFGYECEIIRNKLDQQITTIENLLQVFPGAIRLKKISSLTKMIDPSPQVNCVFSAESLLPEIRFSAERKAVFREKKSEEDLLTICRNLFRSYESKPGYFATTIYLPNYTIDGGYSSCEVTSLHLEKNKALP